MAAFVGLNARTLELFDAYAEAGVDFEMHRFGLLLVARTSEGLASYAAMFEEIGRFGYDGQIATLDPAGACELEPALDVRRITGGMHTLIDRYVRPESLTAGLAADLRGRGIEVRESVAVTGMRGKEPVCASSPTTALSRPTASSSPRAPPRGRCSRRWACGCRSSARAATASPSRAAQSGRATRSTWPRRRSASARYEDAVRIAGVFELGHDNDALDRRRLAAMIADCEPCFGSWRPAAERAETEWAGLRTMTADGLPLIGRAPAADNVFLATGRGISASRSPRQRPPSSHRSSSTASRRRELEPFRPGRWFLMLGVKSCIRA